jgi:hypothetical protein
MNQSISMQRFFMPAVWLMGLALVLAPLRAASAASYGVRDNAHFFSADAIRQAEQGIQQINERHQHDLLIETIPSLSDEQRQSATADPRQFWEQFTDQHALKAGVRGVYVLICKDPPHIQAAVGSSTRQRLFTSADRDELVRPMATDFRQKNYDQGLLNAVRFVEQRMDQNAPATGGGASAAQRSSPGFPVQQPVPRPGWGIGGIACVIIGAVLLILLFRGIFGRSGSSYGGGYYPPGGYPQGGAYPPGGYPAAGGYGGYGGGGGGGFGRGFLGGLLGGALGGYAADRWINHGQGGGAVPPAAGGDLSSGADTSFSSSGADFGSSDASSGADFGGGGGGADFGGGGGGSDFGGGGDAGGSSGSDF